MREGNEVETSLGPGTLRCPRRLGRLEDAETTEKAVVEAGNEAEEEEEEEDTPTLARVPSSVYGEPAPAVAAAAAAADELPKRKCPSGVPSVVDDTTSCG